MKRITALCLFVLVAGFAFAQKVIEYPDFGLGSTRVTITKIELTNTETALTFRVNMEAGSRCGIAAKSYIQVVGNPDTLFMVRKEAPEPVDGWIIVPEGGLSYTLFFPPIDPKTEKIDFGEPVANSWKIFDIVINKTAFVSVLPEEFSGNWFSAKTGKWEYSFFEKIAIAEEKVWEYVSVKKLDQLWKVVLKSDEKEKTLYAQSDNKDCYFGGSPESLKAYSPDFTGIEIPETENFDTPVTNPAEVTYRGYIRNFSERLGANTGLITVMNAITRQMDKYVINIGNDGYFSVNFTLDLPQVVTVSLPKISTQQLFFEPGKSLFHLANSGIPEQYSLFMGESAVLNYDWEKLPKLEANSPAFFEAVAKMNFDEYADFIQAKKEKANGELAAQKNLSEKARTVGKMNIQFQFASTLLRFNQNKRMGNFYLNRKLKNDEQITFSEEKVTTDELEKLLKSVPVNNEAALLCNWYGSLISALKLTDFKLGNMAYYHQMQIVKSNLMAEGIKLTAEETEMFEFIRLNFIENYNDEAISNFSKLYRTPWSEFRKKHDNAIQKHMDNYYTENLAKNAKEIFGVESGLVIEYPLTQNYLVALNKAEKPDANEFNATKNAINDPGLKEYVISEYYKKKAETEVLTSGGEPVLKTEGDKIFHNILKNYKGKVVYVDFWATWCGPCKAGIEQIKPLKEELKNEDIAFVYITNPTSPEKDYAKMKPDIKGEHFKITSDEWNHLAAKFNIYGIPHYTLVDKNGRVVQKHLPHYDNNELKKVLIDELNK